MGREVYLKKKIQQEGARLLWISRIMHHVLTYMVRYSKIHERWRGLISHLGKHSVSNSESCWVVPAIHTNNFSLLHKEWRDLPFLLFYKAVSPSWQATGFDETDSLDLKRPISQGTPVLTQQQTHSSSSEIPNPYTEAHLVLTKLGADECHK